MAERKAAVLVCATDANKGDAVLSAELPAELRKDAGAYATGSVCPAAAKKGADAGWDCPRFPTDGSANVARGAFTSWFHGAARHHSLSKPSATLCTPLPDASSSLTPACATGGGTRRTAAALPRWAPRKARCCANSSLLMLDHFCARGWVHAHLRFA